MFIDSETSRRNRRSSIARAALAVLAFLGIGLGVTTAVWSDNVWFTSAVSTKTFNLQGSVTDATSGWKDSATEGSIELTIPSTIWAGLEPSKSVATKIWVKNVGSADAKMAAPAFTLVGATGNLAMDASTGLTVTSAGLIANETLAAGAVKEITVTITTGANLVQGGGGNLHIQLSGQSLT